MAEMPRCAGMLTPSSKASNAYQPLKIAQSPLSFVGNSLFNGRRLTQKSADRGAVEICVCPAQ
jgi:hypothetical protein